MQGGKESPATDVANVNNLDDNDNTNVAADTKTANVSNAMDHVDPFINCPSNLPNFPIAFPQLEKAQQEDATIQNTAHCMTKRFCDHNLKCCAKKRIAKCSLSEALVPAAIKWCHHTMGHAGANQSSQSISQICAHQDSRTQSMILSKLPMLANNIRTQDQLLKI